MITKKQKTNILLKKYRLKDVDSPRMTPSHPIYKAIVLADLGTTVKIIRFGRQGYGHNYSDTARMAFKKRHAKNISRGKVSAAYWADKFLWTEGGKTRRPEKEE